ncbi:MAG TPA: FAD:protein FMN transferase [Acidimicrobiales bacterium]|nr:FAD:protein FMN transferase [Acidimicrobiales bacterium]
MSPRTATIQHRETVMGTVVTIDLFRAGGIDPRAVVGPVARAVEALHRADRVFSTWREASPMSRLRRGEIGLGEAPPEVADVLDACRKARDLSRGWFDPWAMPGGVDPTGLVKGWAAERALDALRDAPLDGAMVNAAGDITTFGGPGPGRRFRVGVVRPEARMELATIVEVTGAIATSGTYERGAHLIDPFTREARARVASATVTGADLGLADALATALCVGGAEVLDALEAVNGYEGLTIGVDGVRAATSGFPFARALGATA